RDDRREGELVGVVALEFRRREAGRSDLEVPVAGEPAAVTFGERSARQPEQDETGKCRAEKAIVHEAPSPCRRYRTPAARLPDFSGSSVKFELNPGGSNRPGRLTSSPAGSSFLSPGRQSSGRAPTAA